MRVQYSKLPRKGEYTTEQKQTIMKSIKLTIGIIVALFVLTSCNPDFMKVTKVKSSKSRDICDPIRLANKYEGFSH